MTNLSEKVTLFDIFSIPKYFILFVIVGVFGYILIYSLLQVRQITVLQTKLTTDADSVLRIFAWLYFLVQVFIFVVVLLIL